MLLTGKTDIVAQVVLATNWQPQYLIYLALVVPLVQLTATIFTFKYFPASGKYGTCATNSVLPVSGTSSTTSANTKIYVYQTALVITTAVYKEIF